VTGEFAQPTAFIRV